MAAKLKKYKFLQKDPSGAGYYYSTNLGDGRVYFDPTHKQIDLEGVFPLDTMLQIMEEVNKILADMAKQKGDSDEN